MNNEGRQEVHKTSSGARIGQAAGTLNTDYIVINSNLFPFQNNNTVVALSTANGEQDKREECSDVPPWVPPIIMCHLPLQLREFPDEIDRNAINNV